MATDMSSDSEDIPDSFTCSICLDLLYKPVVLSCGHVSCFWCVHKSMNSISESYCPICRHSYYHFPTISQTLHFLLLKLYPAAYRRREEQTLEEETKTGFFSPQFDSNAHKENEQSNHLDSSKSLSNPRPVGNEEAANGSRKQLPITVTDVECSSCKQLLFRPVFLNCSHGYCESCISCRDVEVLKCQLCPSLHPSGVLKVCLELHHFLEKQFPSEYSLRNEAVQLKQVQIKNVSNGSTIASKKDFAFPLVKNDSKKHYGVGCDYCGMYPIVGERYKCVDCFEKIGFDLCGDCYNSSSKLPGRFNQQHTPQHKFVPVDPLFPHIQPGQFAQFHLALANYIGPIHLSENESHDPPSDTDAEDQNST